MEETEEIKLSEEAFAVYSLPGSSDHVLIRGVILPELPLEGAFVFQGFDNNGLKPSFLSCNQVDANTAFTFDLANSCAERQTTKEDYLRYVQDTIQAIRKGIFEKVVLSRIKNVKRQGHNLYDLFVSLKSSYEDAFVFLYHIPGEGCWCGATPEVLLEKKGIDYYTMALAGTQSDRGLKFQNVSWGEKELHEQSVIEVYIESVLKGKSISYRKEGPETIKAGQVLHILSTYIMKDVADPLQLSNLLHPGPAISGLPKTGAINWIKEHEGHDRAHYCGYIGPWDIMGNRSLFINLRSMQVYSDQFSLYLGGGITADSSALKEWDETELKARTLLSVLDKLQAT